MTQETQREAAHGNLRLLVGRSVADFFPVLCRLKPEIARLNFTTYRRDPGLDRRLKELTSPEVEELRQPAQKVHEETGIPFWNALLGIAAKSAAIPDELVDAALTHVHAPATQRYSFAADQLSAEALTNIIGQLAGGYGLAVSSKVLLTSGHTVHIPMLDFLCPQSMSCERAIRRMLALTGRPEGVLVNSGRSYHFYGASLLDMDEWVTFLCKALLFAPISDPRYIAHRLIDGECLLKVGEAGDGFVPTIVHALCEHDLLAARQQPHGSR